VALQLKNMSDTQFFVAMAIASMLNTLAVVIEILINDSKLRKILTEPDLGSVADAGVRPTH
jgi:hypothetical protein